MSPAQSSTYRRSDGSYRYPGLVSHRSCQIFIINPAQNNPPPQMKKDGKVADSKIIHCISHKYLLIALQMNSTPFCANAYNEWIRQLIPYYEQIQQEVIDFISIAKPHITNWIDSGCGSGHSIRNAIAKFAETNFFLCDPAKDMLTAAKQTLQDIQSSRISFHQHTTQDIPSSFPPMDIATAILTHHFCTPAERIKATKNVFDILSPGWVYVTVEMIKPHSPEWIDLSLKKRGKRELDNWRSEEDITNHLARYDTKYFPITIQQHISLLQETGFQVYDIFWLSNVQAWFYAIK